MSFTRSSWKVVIGISLVVLAGLPASAGDSRPIRGRAYEDVTGAQPVADGLQVTTHGAGIANHLGLFTRDATVVIHPDGTITGSVTFTAANGDELVADLDGGQSQAEISGIYTFNGGSGRFSDASGSAVFTAVTADGLHVDIVFSGKIAY